MAQRWMQAKETIAKKNGRVKSGAGRAMGEVFEDRIMTRGKDVILPPPVKPTREQHSRRIVNVSRVKRNIRGTVVILKADRPKAWTYTGADAYTC